MWVGRVAGSLPYFDGYLLACLPWNAFVASCLLRYFVPDAAAFAPSARSAELVLGLEAAVPLGLELLEAVPPPRADVREDDILGAFRAVVDDRDERRVGDDRRDERLLERLNERLPPPRKPRAWRSSRQNTRRTAANNTSIRSTERFIVLTLTSNVLTDSKPWPG